jgi:HAD superfamily 5'-nucleotidase-like hydrolase
MDAPNRFGDPSPSAPGTSASSSDSAAARSPRATALATVADPSVAHGPGMELPPPARHVFTNRTLNLRSIKAIGFDMDYTLIHYRTEAWERRAYEHVQRKLAEQGWPVGDLTFDPEFAMLGLILDLDRGNLVKANRFGYVKKASHGTRMLEYDELRRTYSRELVDLSEPRWVFLNTLFGMSEATLFAQLVDLASEGKLPRPTTYGELYRLVRSNLDGTHMEGTLKAEILAEPDRFVELDPELPIALLDLKAAGKKLLVITNSEWPYTRALMSFAFDRFLPTGQTWRDLFDLVVVSARKPSFFEHPNPAFEVVDDAGLLRPHLGKLELGRAYLGGNAALVEESLGLSGDDLLFVGDHIFSDVNVSKNLLRWRTALVVRELERELDALEAFKPHQARITELMERKSRLDYRMTQVKLALLRIEHGHAEPQPIPGLDVHDEEALRAEHQRLREAMASLDGEIGPLAKEADELQNTRWGLLMRAGNDKSHLARQIERYADVYTSRVSNLVHWSPFAYLRSPRGSLPHDSGRAGGVQT